MSHLSLPRLRAGTALTLACLMLAAPIHAQEAGGTPQAPAMDQQPAPVPATPDSAAPSPQATPAPAADAPATTTSAPTAAAPQPASDPAPASVTPSVPETTAPAETAPVPVVPATQPETVPQAQSGGILPQILQDALDPLTPAERDPNLPHDLSPIGMFLAADWVVKGVMIGLAFASVVTWTVLIAKFLELAGALGRVQSGIRRIEAAASLPAALGAIGARRDPVSRMIRAAATEYDRSAPALDQAGDSGLKERVDSHLDRIEAVAGRRMGRGTGVLATIGSTAPFVGLFGTVWGIMNSFIGISEAQTTNLAVVAPGIAEALLATAIGLVAAIPAVVIYNVFARAITGYRLRLANAAAGVKRLVSRDLDFRGTDQRSEV
ncbi:tonB-system energizer ExbB [Paracoccus sp. CPCC 101403]|uniref:Biopolymer transport protein ExbB n=1 Tax=Paracoccus broussonetiae TaxID=3075834 RepID=A0ABU3E8J8_9RHOB|nr:tonB-system energizer ExbB [Paracoccus sp. CPCC 101403]MDT1060486.1 tonB-system energizer ExbB [Paracoccus sp. CPCC 101403]